MKYINYTILIVALVGGSASAAQFDLLRNTDAAIVRASASYDNSTTSPYLDSVGTLSDGQTYFYLVRDPQGAFEALTVEKDVAGDRVCVTFDDALPLPDADPSLSSVSVSNPTIPADGVTTVMITIVPRDSSGQPLGPGLSLSLDESFLAPGGATGPIQDLGDGSYVVHVASSQIGQGTVEIDVNGVVLDDRPALAFQSVFDDAFVVNVTGTGDQTGASVGQATHGGSVMIWQGEDADGDGILGRVFNADGSPAGTEFVINATTTGNQTNPDVAVAADRSFVVVWQADDADGSGVYAQLFDVDGVPFGGEFLVNEVEHNNQEDPRVIMADDGSFVVVWKGTDSDGNGIWARMYDSFGQAISGEFLVNTDEDGDQESPETAMTGDGRFVVSWQATSEREGIFAQLYNAVGGPVGTTIDVQLGLNGQEGIPAVAMSDTGAFTAVWQGDDGSSIGIVARAFDAAGLPFTPDAVVVNTTTNGVQNHPDVAMADDGQSLVVWHGHSTKKIFGQRFDVVGAPLGDEFLISEPGASKPDMPVAALAGDGSSYIVLYEAEDGDGMGIFASWVPLL